MLFKVTPVTLEPMPPLIVVVPEPAPVLVTVPALLTAAVEKVMVPVVPLLAMVRLLVPVTPPLNIVEIVVPLVPKVRVPVPPDCSTTGLAMVRLVVPMSKEAAFEPLV